MDILEVLILQYEANMSEHILEMNACLMTAQEAGCIDRLDKAVSQYSHLKQKVDVLKDLKGQIVATKKFEQQEAEKNED